MGWLPFKKKKSQQSPARRRSIPEQAASFNEEMLKQRYAFRKNRTLTGSVSSSVSSVGEQSADLKSPRVRAHELVHKRRHVGGILFGTIVCIAALFWLLLQFTATVITKAAPDSSVNLDATYADAINEYLKDHPVERLRFLLDETRLSQAVQEVAPEVKEVRVDGGAGIGQGTFSVLLRSPIAGWNINGKQRYVDEAGVSFDRNYFATPSVRISDKSGLETDNGKAVASNRFLEFVGRLVGLAKAHGYTVEEVAIPASSTRQVELRLKGVAYPIRLSIDRSAGEQVEDMARAVEWFKKRNEAPQYLDVRVSRRAFYRL